MFFLGRSYSHDYFRFAVESTATDETGLDMVADHLVVRADLSRPKPLIA